MEAASFIICLAAKLQIAGTVSTHRILQAWSSNLNSEKAIDLIYSNDLANTTAAGSSLPLAALILSLAVIFYKINNSST